ncbi:uncharacterized protein LOC111344382 [Stylophora pistillata]|uniref:uncharacterized protein LOC111344382 n=1 Tax=Stylophora pistillata TaxID=50429 RepID=UPI000C052507|nr:uncharacterized protein LOC111344382 [Stylophora pistillata]
METSSENEVKLEEAPSDKESGIGCQGFEDKEKSEQQHHHDDKQLDASYQIPALSKSRVFFLNISWFGMNVMYLILSVEVVPSQVYALVGSGQKGQVLGGMVAAGAGNDRLVSQYGKRRPLMLGGTVLLCISLFGMAFSAPDIESDISNVTCSMDLKLRRCLPYYNLTILEQSEDNSTVNSDTSFLLSMLMGMKWVNRVSPVDTHIALQFEITSLYIAFYLCVMACYSIMSVPYNGLIADLTPPFQRENWSGGHVFPGSHPVLFMCSAYCVLLPRANSNHIVFVSSVIGGFLSDRLGRRKPLVIGSAILMSVCAVILAGLQGKYAFYASMPVALTFGVGFGAYCAVDFALVMDVLPNDREKAKDLAVWHQALVLPQAIATPTGGIILDMFEKLRCDIGLGYIILFLVTSVYFVLSGIFVYNIKKAK